MTDKQIDELAKLPSGVAAVYQDKWIEPVLCKVNYYNVLPEEYKRQQEIEKQPTENVLRGKILQYILSDISQEEPKTDVELLKAELLRSNMPSYLKIGIMKALKGTKPKSLKEVYGFVAECIEQIDDIFRNGRHA